jgi:hypothetical protein
VLLDCELLIDECNKDRTILNELLFLLVAENTQGGKTPSVSNANFSPLKGCLVGFSLEGLLVGCLEGCAVGRSEG